MARESIQNHATAQQKGSSRWKKIAAKYGIDAPLVLLMIKYVIPYCFGLLPVLFNWAERYHQPQLLKTQQVLNYRNSMSPIAKENANSSIKGEPLRLPLALLCMFSSYILEIKTDALKISDRLCCETFLDNWLSHPNNVHPNRSGAASGAILPEPCCDLCRASIIHLWKYDELIGSAFLAFDLFRSCNFATCDVVCS